MADNLVDRLVGYFSPERALRRVAARHSMLTFGVGTGGYQGGARDRRALRNWRPFARSANEDILPDLLDLRTRSRDLVRNVPIAAGAVSSVVTNVVGDGMALQPAIDFKRLGLTADQARAWQKNAATEFCVWARHPDFTDRLNFDELQALVLRSTLESGDIFVVRRRRIDPGDTYGLKLQLIEADRVSNPIGKFNSATLADGVVLDAATGRPTGYQISTMAPQEMTLGKQRSWTEYDKGSTVTGSPLILHLFDQRRPEQARGIPYLAPVIEAIKQLGDYADAEIRAAVVSAMFTVFIEHKTENDGETPSVGTADPSTDGVDADTEISLGTGAVVDLEDGAKAQFANPLRPNTAFEAFVIAMARQIGVALELPYEVLLKSFEASYSASRASLEMAWQFFRSRRCWLAAKFCQPVYEWVITEAVSSGRLAAPGFFDDPVLREAWLGCNWIGPSRISLDPLKEARADLFDLGMKVKTRSQIIMERTGGDFESKVATLAEENQALIDAGLDPALPSTSANAQGNSAADQAAGDAGDGSGNGAAGDQQDNAP